MSAIQSSSRGDGHEARSRRNTASDSQLGSPRPPVQRAPPAGTTGVQTRSPFENRLSVSVICLVYPFTHSTICRTRLEGIFISCRHLPGLLKILYRQINCGHSNLGSANAVQGKISGSIWRVPQATIGTSQQHGSLSMTS